MYSTFLAIHNIARWLVLIVGVVAVVSAGSGWLGKRPWSRQDRLFGTIFSSVMDLQLLVGLILYVFLSPITRSGFADFGAAMSNAGARFFLIEHLFYMVLAVVFGHMGSILPRKVENATAKHQRAFLWFGLALILVLLGIPWMRPLFPGV